MDAAPAIGDPQIAAGEKRLICGPHTQRGIFIGPSHENEHILDTIVTKKDQLLVATPVPGGAAAKSRRRLGPKLRQKGKKKEKGL